MNDLNEQAMQALLKAVKHDASYDARLTLVKKAIETLFPLDQDIASVAFSMQSWVNEVDERFKGKYGMSLPEVQNKAWNKGRNEVDS